MGGSYSGFVKYKERAVSILSAYIEEGVKSTKGTAISISLKRLKKWYSGKTYRGELSSRLKHAVAGALRALHSQGLISKVGSTYLVYKGSKMWLAAEEGKARWLIKLALDSA